MRSWLNAPCSGVKSHPRDGKKKNIEEQRKSNRHGFPNIFRQRRHPIVNLYQFAADIWRMRSSSTTPYNPQGAPIKLHQGCGVSSRSWHRFIMSFWWDTHKYTHTQIYAMKLDRNMIQSICTEVAIYCNCKTQSIWETKRQACWFCSQKFSQEYHETPQSTEEVTCGIWRIIVRTSRSSMSEPEQRQKGSRYDKAMFRLFR